jgi:hypothetical protein
MSFPRELLALGVILLFGILLYIAIRTSRREKFEQDNQLRQLGFVALDTAPPELARRVEELYRTNKKREIKLWKVYRRLETDQDLYLFDTADTRGENSEMESEIFAIISRRFTLPRFSLVTLPDFDQAGLIGNLMEMLLDKVMSRAERYLQLERVEFPHSPELDDQVVLFGSDPVAIREMFARIETQILGISQSHLPIQIAGNADFLTVDFSTSISQDLQGHDLASRYQTFVQISRLFME